MLEYKELKELVGKKNANKINEDVVKELNKLNTDPDYGDIFVDGFIEHFDVLNENRAWNVQKYIEAMKFYMLLSSDHSVIDAYIKTRPHRLSAVLKNGKTKASMTGEASRYNTENKILQSIKARYNINMSVVFRSEYFKSVKSLVELRDTSKSDRIRMESAATLLKELKPAEDINLNIKSEIGNDMLADLSAQLATIALQSKEQLETGQINLKQLGALKPKDEVIDVESE